MGRPNELTEKQRAELLAKGHKPVEIWVLDWEDPTVVTEIEEECRQIRDSDRRSEMDQTLDAFARDVWDEFR